MHRDHDAEIRARLRSTARHASLQTINRADYRSGQRRAANLDGISRRVSTKNQQKPPPLPIIYPDDEPVITAQRFVDFSATQYASDQTHTDPQWGPYDQRESPQSQAKLNQIAQPEAITKPQRQKLHWSTSNLLTGMAIFVFMAGLAAAWNGWVTNQHIAAQATQASKQTDSAVDEAAPSTTKPSDDAVRNYAVAPTLPRYIDITGLGVHARIMPMSVTTNNQLKAPGNVYDAGWYSSSARPGEQGAMLIDGHISSWQTKGVFYGINKLKQGDAIRITRGDGRVFDYLVTGVTTVPADQVNMSKLLLSAEAGKPGLNLISCFGDVIPGTNEFDKRVVVTTVLK